MHLSALSYELFATVGSKKNRLNGQLYFSINGQKPVTTKVYGLCGNDYLKVAKSIHSSTHTHTHTHTHTLQTVKHVSHKPQ